MASGRLLGYLAMATASALFILVGAMLLFAPLRFSEWMRWWARQIHFPQRPSLSVPGATSTLRVPGLAILCFGGFVLYKILRSLFIEL
jgi:hypothetical protein